MLSFVQVQGRQFFNRMNTLSILRINPLKYGGGLKFESDPRGIGYAPIK